MSRLSTFQGRVKLLLQLSRVNLRMSSITLIGLTIALSMIAACTIYLETNKANYYLELLEDPEFKRSLEYRIRSYDYDPLSLNDILNMQQVLSIKINESHLETILFPATFSPFCELEGSLYYLNQSQSGVFLGLTLDDSILNDCVEGSSLPTTMNEVIVYSPDQITLELGKKFNITKKYYPNPQSDERKNYTYTLTISGIITPETLKETSPLINIVRLHRYTLITDIKEYLSLLQTMDSELSSLTTTQDHLRTIIKFHYNIDISAIHKDNVVSVIDDFYSYLEFTAWGVHLEGYYFNTSGNLYSKLYSKITEFNSFFFLFMTISVPAFIVTFLLINFSLGIINEKRKKDLALFKMRGLSSSFILLILTIETIIISLLASGLGFILGIPFSILITTTTGFLIFDINRIPETVVISENNFLLILILGFILTGFSHLRTVFRLARSGIVELEQEASKKKKRKPGMIRGNVDIFLLTQGTLGILLLNMLMVILPKANLNTVEGFTLFLPIIIILIVFSPLAFLIGFIFAFNRFILVIIHQFGSFFWRKDWRLLAVATRNLAVNASVTKRTSLLIACTISFLMILSIFPNSIFQHSVNNTYYKVGSDISIRIPKDSLDFNRTELDNFTSRLNNISGLSVTRISELDYSFEIGNFDWMEFEIIGIESNFDKIAFWRHIYDDKSFEKLVSSLYSSTEDFPVIIDSVSASLENLRVGEKYTISSGSASEQVEVAVEEITDYWPGLIVRRNEGDRFLITKYALVKNITMNIFGYSNTDEEVWCKIAKGYNETQIINRVRNISAEFGVSQNWIQSAAEKTEINPDSISDNFLWVITNFNFIAALSVTLIVIILYTITRISSHATEISLSRVLGMKHRQIFILMFSEPFLLFLISGVPGGIVGTLLLFGFVNFGAPMFNYGPPFVLLFDITSIIIIYGSILIVTIICGIITSFMATRANISKILKVE